MISNKEIVFYCNNCHHKEITKNFSHYKQHIVPSIPVLYDNKTRKINSKNRRKQFKCPKCGYVIIPKFINEQFLNDDDLDSQGKNDSVN